MKNLFKNIWQAPSSTIAGALVAAIGVAVAADLDMPKWLIVALSATSAFLAVFDGPNEMKKTGKLPVVILLAGLAILFTPSCGTTAQFNIPLPDELGGGSIPIVIQPDK